MSKCAEPQEHISPVSENINQIHAALDILSREIIATSEKIKGALASNEVAEDSQKCPVDMKKIGNSPISNELHEIRRLMMHHAGRLREMREDLEI